MPAFNRGSLGGANKSKYFRKKNILLPWRPKGPKMKIYVGNLDPDSSVYYFVEHKCLPNYVYDGVWPWVDIEFFWLNWNYQTRATDTYPMKE